MSEMHVLERIRPLFSHAPSGVARNRSDSLSHDVASSSLIVEASCLVPTAHGPFTMHVFRTPGDPREHVAMVRGDVSQGGPVPVRVHSECLTSEVFHSLKCDCREQLHAAMQSIAELDRGVLLYLRQEGRGIGLANKIRAYALQSLGADTVDANRMLGLPDDARSYDMAAAMLGHLGVTSVRLLTNNPDKVEAMRSLGVTVIERVPVLIAPNPHSLGYLEAKRDRMRHHLPARGAGVDARGRAHGIPDAE